MSFVRNACDGVAAKGQARCPLRVIVDAEVSGAARGLPILVAVHNQSVSH